MAQFNIEVTPPGLPITASSGRNDVVRLQEWLVASGINVGANPGAPSTLPAAAGIDGGFGSQTAAGCSAFAAANGLANGTVDAAFWRALTAGMGSAFSFRSTQPAVGAAVVETAQAHFARKPLEARRLVNGRLLGKDNSGPWVRAYCAGVSDEWCQGAASQWVTQAFAALNRPLPFPLDAMDVLPLFVPSIVTSANEAGRLVLAETRRRCRQARSSSSAAVSTGRIATSMSASPSRRSAATAPSTRSRATPIPTAAPTDSKFAASSAGGRPATSDCWDRAFSPERMRLAGCMGRQSLDRILRLRDPRLGQDFGLIQRAILTEGMFMEEGNTGRQDSPVLRRGREHVAHGIRRQAEPVRLVECAGKCTDGIGKAFEGQQHPGAACAAKVGGHALAASLGDRIVGLGRARRELELGFLRTPARPSTRCRYCAGRNDNGRQ